MSLDRREFLKLLGAGGLASSLPLGGLLTSSCEGYSWPPPGSEARTLHFDLSHTRAGVEHTLQLGCERIVLAAHTADTRRYHRSLVGALNGVPDANLTHYADLALPANACQTYFVTHRHPDPARLPYLSTAGTWVPPAVLQRVAPQLHAAKARRMRVLQRRERRPADDPMDAEASLADFVSMEDAATFIVFHHPELLSLDPEVLATVQQHITSAPTFHLLVASLISQGRAQSIDGWNEGYEGWANGQYLLDPSGDKIPDGAGGYRWAYTLTDDTTDAMRPVVADAMRLVRDDPSLAGRRYSITPGIHAIDGELPGAASVVLRDGDGPDAPIVANTPYQYKLSDEDWQQFRKIEITEVAGRTVTFRVHNSCFIHLGIYARFLDVTGGWLRLDSLGTERPVATVLDTAHATFLGMLEPRGQFMGIPTQAEDFADFTITLPASASAVDILVGSLGVGALDASRQSYEDVHLPGAVVTAVLDLAIPAMFLALGVWQVDGPGKALIKDLASFLLQFAVGGVARGILQAQGIPHDSLFTSWGMDIISAVVAAAPAAIIDLLAWAAVKAGEAAMAAVMPVVGLIWTAIGVAASLAQLTESTVSIFGRPWVVPNQLTSSLDVDVTIHPDPANFQFPASATRYQVVVYYPNTDKTPRVIDRVLSDPAVPVLHAKFAAAPAGGRVVVGVAFYAANGWVAAHAETAPLDNLVPAGSESLTVSLTITENTLPLTAHTRYVQQERLTLANGVHAWQASTTPPAATKTALACGGTFSLCEPRGITLNMSGRLGYSWQGAGPGLTECGGATSSVQLHTLQGIDLASAHPDNALQVLQCGFMSPVFLTYRLTGGPAGDHFVIAPAVDPVTGETNYHARKIVLSGIGSIDVAGLKSYGRFAFDRIRQVVYHPSGYLIALHQDKDKLEILQVPGVPYASDADALFAFQAGGRGTMVGLLHGARAIAPTQSGLTFLVLEADNARLQAFNVRGNVVPYFGAGLPRATEVPLTSQPEDVGHVITYLDMALESQGYIYVLSHLDGGDQVNQFRLDIYNPDGSFLARTKGVTAARLVVDVWRVMYTLNYELLTGLTGRPEPSVGKWLPTA